MKRLIYCIASIVVIAGAIGVAVYFASARATPAEKLMAEHPYVFSSEGKNLGTEHREKYLHNNGCVYLAYPETKNTVTDQTIRQFVEEAKSQFETFSSEEREDDTLIPKMVFDYKAEPNDRYCALKLSYGIGNYQLNAEGQDLISKEKTFYLDAENTILGLDGVLGENSEKKINLMLKSSGKSTDNLEDFTIADDKLVLRWIDTEEELSVKEIERAGLIDPTKPMIALTFDDGPGKYSRKFADLLAQYNGHGTFFVLGMNVSTFAESLKYVYDMGNEIGSHTMRHKNLNKLTEAEIKKEITDASDAIYKAIGAYPTLVRTPYGNANEKVFSVLQSPMIKWNVDTEDWKSLNAQAVKTEIVKNIKDGDIVLMHEIYESTYEGLALALEELSRQGYQFVTVSELMRYRGITPENKIYHSFPPDKTAQ